MADDKDKPAKGIDKLVMGAIIGGAIGSVLGMTFAPKSGKETRKRIWTKAKDWFQKGKKAKDEFMEQHGDQIETIKEKIESKRKGLFSFLKSKLSKQEESSGIPVEKGDRDQR